MKIKNCGFKARRGSHKRIKKTGIYNSGELIRCEMMPCQREMFDDYNQRFVIDNAPPGSGKSTTIKFVHGDYLESHPNHKLVISIPQTFIRKTFQQVELKYPDGSTLYWDIDQDICDTTPNKVNKIVTFLKIKKFAAGIEQRVLLCTHAALAKAYDKLKNKSVAFVNTTLVVDEAHRLLYAENGSVSVANQLGHIINHLVLSNPKGFRGWLATATFFRGDRLSILKEEVYKKFSIRYLPMDRHWEENIRYLESYSYDFIVYKHKPWKEIRTILSKNKKKTVIFCPAKNRPLADGCKYQFVENLKKHIRKVRPGARILDLVDESGREERKQVLYSDKTAKDVDVVLAVNIFDEGADWVFGEQAIDLTPSNSLRVIVQRFGRIIRDVCGKKHVNYYTFLPFVTEQLDEEAYRKKLSSHFNVFTASLLLEEYIKPVGLPKPKKKSSKNGNGSYINYFVQQVPDENKRGQIVAKAQENLISLKAITSNPTLKQTQQCIIDALKHYKVKKHLDVISKQIAFMWRRRLKTNGQDLGWMLKAGFDKIWSDDIYDMLRQFGSGLCDKKTFEEFREVYGNLFKSPQEWVCVAENLAKENNGVLPPVSWLNENGYSRLPKIMPLHPDLFSHIKQEKLRLLPQEWVPVAEQLAKENKGILPNTSFLSQNYPGLYSCLIIHPELFSHIKRKKWKLSIDEHLVAAQQLVDKYGAIPNHRWLTKNGHGGLCECMRNNAEIFNDFPKEWKGGKKVGEWVQIAEETARDNNGILPQKSKLDPALVRVMHKYPHKFSHIPQDKAYKSAFTSIDEWIQRAENIAANNNGTLPCPQILKETDYEFGSGDRLYQVILKNRNRFKHIPMDKKKKSLNDNVKIAERLALDNGGKIPSTTWLGKNGYSGLRDVIRKYPNSFNHLDQEYNGGKTDADWVAISEKLAKKNGGRLPSYHWLKHNGYNALLSFKFRKPHLFDHLDQEEHVPNVAKHEKNVAIAKKLANENNGKIPYKNWLVNNGYRSLYNTMKRYPELFKDIPQESKTKTPQEWVGIAENLCRQHNGKLPPRIWLIQNGYYALTVCMERHPKHFEHIDKLSLSGLSPNEHLQEAKALVKEHGYIPSVSWLKNNGYNGLCSAIYNNPCLFKDLPKQKKYHRN